mgnify:CR=1 FL=1|tara:strand:+ start:6590 stop:6763 length:174 start_codon:yes stop_codon:yes gene_type:complete
MRNKELTLRRLQKLEGIFKKLDMEIHRGGSRDSINSTQRDITELIQDIKDIVEREND